MQLFIDTANLDEIRQANELGILDGVTTNPTLIAKEKAEFKPRLKEICRLVKGPVSAEVISTDTEGMIREANDLVKVAENIVVKLPTTRSGVIALKKLADRGVAINMTLCFQPLQALVVAKAGAAYVSPFVGRFDDEAENGMQMIREVRAIYDNYDFETQILVASIRSPLHLVQAAVIGADVATVPFSVLEKMLYHPLTEIGLKRFLEDWQKIAQPAKGEEGRPARAAAAAGASERERERGEEKRQAEIPAGRPGAAVVKRGKKVWGVV